jgi:hypothetical protein
MTPAWLLDAVAAVMLAVAAVSAARLVKARAFAGFLLSPAVTIGCRVAMGVAMAFMLFIAI